MTEAEIIKALEICSNDGFCAECPFNNSSMRCFNHMKREALDLIKRQQVEIADLKTANFVKTDMINCLQEKFENAKVEAVKEFAEKLIRNITINNTNDGYLDYAVDYNCLIEDIQDLVEEMVGETNDR